MAWRLGINSILFKPEVHYEADKPLIRTTDRIEVLLHFVK
jgi:hypothetical protein